MQLDSYQDLIKRLFNVSFFGGMKLGLENAKKLQHLLGYPDKTFTSIHVAGTNGKGSVCTKIARAFEQEGYRVGLYTSPHISSFRERIQINQKMISEESIRSLLPLLFKITEEEQIPATFFELTTLLALHYFALEQVDIVVLETGLGGRLDATNIVHPFLSVITSIAQDHTEILGNSIEAIAIEKGGIIKEKTPVVIGPKVPFKTIEAIALQKQSPCIITKIDNEVVRGLSFEEENRLIAKTALEYLALHFPLSSKSMQIGLLAKQPCRFEVIENQGLSIILDVAHNPDGLCRLFQMVNNQFPGQSVRIIFGLSKNKDITGCLSLIKDHAIDFHLVQANHARGAQVTDLFALLKELTGTSSHICTHSSIKAGVAIAKGEARKHGQVLVICGSFFIMGEARGALGFNDPIDIFDLN